MHRSDQIRRWRPVGLCGLLLCLAVHGVASAAAQTSTPPKKPAHASAAPASKAKHHTSGHATGKRTSTNTSSHTSAHSSRTSAHTSTRTSSHIARTRRRRATPTARRALSWPRRSAASRRLTPIAPGKFRKRSSASATWKASLQDRGMTPRRPRCSAIRRTRDGNRRRLQIPER